MTARDEASVPDPRLGQTVGGKYVLESVLGRGGMGSVYAARHAALGTKVAIKVMHEGMTRDAMFVERFNREAQAASRLDHPNVIRVIDFGRDADDLLYTVMDFAGGSDLGATIARDAPLADTRIVDILGQVLSAIAAAHDVGIVHRDLKPENVIMSVRVDDDGHRLDVARVCDFGIAQIADGNKADGSGRALTLSGTLLGTPQYMPPEQCRGEPLDARADLYSVGVILYQLLTGRLPFDADNPMDVVVKQISEEPLPPSQIRADVSPGLEAVCLCALQKRKENRYPSARAMRAALRDAVPDSFVSSPGPTRPGSGSLRAPSEAPDSQDTGFAPPTLVSPHGLRAPSPEPDANRGSVVSRARMRPLRVTLGLGLLLVAVIPGAFAFHRSRANSESRSATAAASPIPALALAAEHAPESQVVAETLASAETPELPDANEHAAARAAARHEKARASAKGRASAARAIDSLPEPAASLAKEQSDYVAKAPAPEAAPATPRVDSAGSAPRAVTSTPKSIPSAPPVAAPAVSSHLDPERVRVSWRVSSVGGGATAGGVTRALARPAGGWTSCYRASVRAHPEGLAAKSASVRLSCDDQGRVLSATVGGALPQTLAGCIRASAIGITIPNADTGQAWANIDLTFQTE